LAQSDHAPSSNSPDSLVVKESVFKSCYGHNGGVFRYAVK
jgi:hypothetical protein